MWHMILKTMVNFESISAWLDFELLELDAAVLLIILENMTLTVT
jgi:hypothetical protein